MKKMLFGLLAVSLVAAGAPRAARADWKADANHKTDKAERTVKRTGSKVKAKTTRGAKTAGQKTGDTMNKAGDKVKEGGDKLKDKSR
jgi:uncharacterized protein YxeA